jgi:Domain of unknown function (DUF3362)
MQGWRRPSSKALQIIATKTTSPRTAASAIAIGDLTRVRSGAVSLPLRRTAGQRRPTERPARWASRRRRGCSGGRIALVFRVAEGGIDPQRKPSNDDFEQFTEIFNEESAKAGKKQYFVPYFIASHPGSNLDAMIDLAVFLKLNGYRPDQVQDFIPAPFDVATAMFYTGIDPFTKKPVHVAKALRDRKLQRALMQFFKPANYFEVREALRQAGRTDLIGNDCGSLIPPTPPREALEARRNDANARFRGDYVHTIGDGKHKKRSRKESRHEPGKSYRPKPKPTSPSADG